MWLLNHRFALWGSSWRVQVGSAEDRLIQALYREYLERSKGSP